MSATGRASVALVVVLAAGAASCADRLAGPEPTGDQATRTNSSAKAPARDCTAELHDASAKTLRAASVTIRQEVSGYSGDSGGTVVIYQAPDRYGIKDPNGEWGRITIGDKTWLAGGPGSGVWEERPTTDQPSSFFKPIEQLSEFQQAHWDDSVCRFTVASGGTEFSGEVEIKDGYVVRLTEPTMVGGRDRQTLTYRLGDFNQSAPIEAPPTDKVRSTSPPR